MGALGFLKRHNARRHLAGKHIYKMLVFIRRYDATKKSMKAKRKLNEILGENCKPSGVCHKI